MSQTLNYRKANLMDEGAQIMSMQGLLKSICNHFCRHDPFLDKEELFGEMQILALKAIRRWDASKSSITSFVHSFCYLRMIDMLRNKNERLKLHRPIENCHVEPRVFDLQAMLFELSDEAREAIQLALGEDLRKVRLQQRLREQGWQYSTIFRVFKEIQEALQ